VRAVITDPVAVKKLRARVYCGFVAVVTIGAGGGVPEIQRVCLVDHPSALGKRSGVKSRELYLKKDVAMHHKPAPTLAQAEDGLLNALSKVRGARHNQRSGDEAAIAAIAKAQRAPYRGNDGVMDLLTKRARIR
jgi:hypothetical protein